jgi:hypothetical protein
MGSCNLVSIGILTNRAQHYLRAVENPALVYTREEVEYLTRLSPLFRAIHFWADNQAVPAEQVLNDYSLNDLEALTQMASTEIQGELLKRMS